MGDSYTAYRRLNLSFHIIIVITIKTKWTLLDKLLIGIGKQAWNRKTHGLHLKRCMYSSIEVNKFGESQALFKEKHVFNPWCS